MSEIHPQAKQAFQEGLESVLRQWTALELAVLNQWGGPSSGEKANQLYEELLGKFMTRASQLYKDELADYLDSFMEVNFCTICEDDSTTELAELLLAMWTDACRGNFTLITNALAREYMRSEVVAQCQGVDQSGDVVDDDEDDDMDEDGGEDGNEPGDGSTSSGPPSGGSAFGISSSSSAPTISPTSAATLAAIPEAEDSDEMMAADDGADAWEEVGKKKGGNRNKGRR